MKPILFMSVPFYKRASCKALLKRSLLCSVIASLSACSSMPEHQGAYGLPETIYYPGKLNTELTRHYSSWQGTPYRWGGTDRKGVDCSGLVFITYRDVLGLHIPRTTGQLIDEGIKISSRQMKPGDLVFFRTGNKQRHVGIYLDNGEFFHASFSKGVVTSNLDSPYWSDAYQQSRRLIAFNSD